MFFRVSCVIINDDTLQFCHSAHLSALHVAPSLPAFMERDDGEWEVHNGLPW